MVGYITASIKNVRDTRVGDTVTDADRPCAEALPGYKSQPDGILRLYPADGAQYSDLRDALEKLRVKRCIPLLRAGDIGSTRLWLPLRFPLDCFTWKLFRERLEREYNLDLVTTAPSVIYKVHKTDGTVIDLTNPSNLPDPSEIDYMEEPLVKAEIMVTTDYIGPILGALPAETRPVSGNGIHGDDACDASLPSPAE